MININKKLFNDIAGDIKFTESNYNAVSREKNTKYISKT